ncbi:hypothetical protein LTR95_005735 [Oleoguttula sp. CCFEE 5521]
MSSFLNNSANLAGTAAPLLRPLTTLGMWSIVMEVWLYALRFPAVEKYKVKIDPSISAASLERALPPQVQWPAQNFNHLHEQPTYFIAAMLTLTLLGVRDAATVNAAWAYVGLRVVHSLVHSTTNTIMVRFSLFALSSTVLAGLIGRTAWVLF